MTFTSAVETILTEALRAPSAHNAQPWRLVPTGADTVELHYDHHDYLPFDPDDRDAYLAMGAFYETPSFARRGHRNRSTCSPRRRAGRTRTGCPTTARPWRPAWLPTSKPWAT